jgi:hypothetical protein
MKKRFLFLCIWGLTQKFAGAQELVSSKESSSTHIEGQLVVDARHEIINTNLLVSYLTKADSTNSINLYLSKDFINITVNGENIKDYVFDTTAVPLPTVHINLKKTVHRGESARFSISYSGNPSEGFWNTDYKWIDLDSDFILFPVFTNFDEFTYKLKARIDGREYKFIDQQQLKLSHSILIESKETNYYFPSIHLATNIRYIKAKEGEYQINLFTKKSDSEVSAIINMAFKIIKFYNSTFGSKVPKHEFSLLIRPLPKSVLPVQKTEGNFIVLAKDQENFETLSHEIAHLWWNRGNHNTMDKWLTESFAEYSKFMFLRYDQGEGVFAKHIAELEKKAKGLPDFLKSSRFGPYGNALLYFKGPYLLYKLEQMIGKEKFIELLTDLNSRGISDTQAFLDELQRVTAIDTRQAFEATLKE